MADPTRVRGSTNTGSSTTASATLASGPDSGNLLVVVVSANGSSTFTAPDGTWTVGPATTSAALATAVFYKFSDGTETSISSTLSNNRGWGIDYQEYTNVQNQAALSDNSQTNGTTATPSGPSVTPASGRLACLCIFWFVSAGATTWTIPAVSGSNFGGPVGGGFQDQFTYTSGSEAMGYGIISTTAGSYSPSATQSSNPSSISGILIFEGSGSSPISGTASLNANLFFSAGSLVSEKSPSTLNAAATLVAGVLVTEKSPSTLNATASLTAAGAQLAPTGTAILNAVASLTAGGLSGDDGGQYNGPLYDGIIYNYTQLGTIAFASLNAIATLTAAGVAAGSFSGTQLNALLSFLAGSDAALTSPALLNAVLSFSIGFSLLPIHDISVFVRTLLQGAVLATTTDALPSVPLTVGVEAVSLLRTHVHAEPGA